MAGVLYVSYQYFFLTFQTNYFIADKSEAGNTKGGKVLTVHGAVSSQ
jgi:hypothetical protein